jgi:hypothetical protein
MSSCTTLVIASAFAGSLDAFVPLVVVDELELSLPELQLLTPRPSAQANTTAR